MTFLRFPSHTLKLNTLDQPHSASEESLMTCDIT